MSTVLADVAPPGEQPKKDMGKTVNALDQLKAELLKCETSQGTGHDVAKMNRLREKIAKLESKKSLDSIERGIEQAKEGKLTDGPTLDKKLKKVLKASRKAAKEAGAKSKEKKKSGPSVRERIFRLLAKAEFGFTRKEVMKKLGITDTQNVFRDEGLSDKPRIKRAEVDGVRGMVYALTARGRKAIENGTIDSERPPSSMLSETKLSWKDGLLSTSGRPRGKKTKKKAK